MNTWKSLFFSHKYNNPQIKLVSNESGRLTAIDTCTQHFGHHLADGDLGQTTKSPGRVITFHKQAWLYIGGKMSKQW